MENFENEDMEIIEEELKNKKVEKPDTLVMEIFAELKDQNKRLAEQNANLTRTVRIKDIISGLVVLLIVGIFMLYLYQYDFASYDQDGNGYNNINIEGGDIYNGAEIKDTP